MSNDPYLGRMIQPFKPPGFSGHPGTATSFSITNPRGMGKPLQTDPRPFGFRIAQALIELSGSPLFEQLGDVTALVTTYPVGIGAPATSRFRHIMKPMHIVSFAPGLLIYQALVSSALRELLGQRETNPSFTTTKSIGASGCLHIHLASTLFAASSKLRVIGNAPMSPVTVHLELFLSQNF